MKIVIALLLALISFDTFSCDVCGGVSAPGTQGLLSSNKFHFIGIKNLFRSYSSINGAHSISVTKSSELFFTSSLLGKWQSTDRLNIQSEIPYAINKQANASNARVIHGVGDLNIRGNYLLINKKTEEGMTEHALTFGAGLKLPTGKFSNDVWGTSNLLPGTGSTDFLISSNYIYRKTRVGILQENSISLKGQNKEGYRYGNAFYTHASVFSNRPISKTKIILPSAGVSYLYTATDKINGSEVSQLFNSGHIINGDLALNLLTTYWMLNLKCSYPIYQKIGNGNVNSRGAIELSIFYLIQKK